MKGRTVTRAGFGVHGLASCFREGFTRALISLNLSQYPESLIIVFKIKIDPNTDRPGSRSPIP
ncbi:hypothetical protein DSCOOX_57890 [Desulfosarcina ovata subsp. ovata]|uniref:Uncharacterized protein n=1 Tax=Desulfosarcina ovata subsp. ovata TaxID=2752305 RepID=A0A5K8AJC6_9BACT|nr:hypothetical protein DSCOOX_57890 [Desulfosarcina ovata subsp. ovata]